MAETRLRTFRCDDEMWKKIMEKAEELSHVYGFSVTVSDLIREGIKIILKGDKNGNCLFKK